MSRSINKFLIEPHSDVAIGVSAAKSAAVSAPVQADAVRDLGLLADEGELRAQLIDNALALQVPNLDA